MKSKRGWASAFCCFLLFIVVCLSLALNMKGAFRASGHPELGLLFFVIPGAVASFVSRKRQLLLPLIGAVLATPLCFVLMRMVIAHEREFWQELAWLFSAVFWCALGALCYLFASSMMSKKGRN